MKIAIACDHGGYRLKQAIIEHFAETGVTYRDFGCDSSDSVDYVPFAKQVSQAVANGSYALGILCCGTGIGMSIAANKVKGIRAAVASDSFSVRMTREHNNANILCLGGRVVGDGLALDLVDLFLSTPFCGEERHVRRVQQIEEQ